MDFKIKTEEVYDKNTCENCLLYSWPEDKCQEYCPKDPNYILKIVGVERCNNKGIGKMNIPNVMAEIIKLIGDEYVKKDSLYMLDTDAERIEDDGIVEDSKANHIENISKLSNQELFKSILDWYDPEDVEGTWLDYYDNWTYQQEIEEFKKRMGWIKEKNKKGMGKIEFFGENPLLRHLPESRIYDKRSGKNKTE